MVIYKTINLINSKWYIGRGPNNNPKYLGSGKLLKRAIKKTENKIWKGYSQQLCAKELNIYQSNINKSLKGERKSSGGYVFRYL